MQTFLFDGEIPDAPQRHLTSLSRHQSSQASICFSPLGLHALPHTAPHFGIGGERKSLPLPFLFSPSGPVGKLTLESMTSSARGAIGSPARGAIAARLGGSPQTPGRLAGNGGGSPNKMNADRMDPIGGVPSPSLPLPSLRQPSSGHRLPGGAWAGLLQRQQQQQPRFAAPLVLCGEASEPLPALWAGKLSGIRGKLHSSQQQVPEETAAFHLLPDDPNPLLATSAWEEMTTTSHDNTEGGATGSSCSPITTMGYKQRSLPPQPLAVGGHQRLLAAAQLPPSPGGGGGDQRFDAGLLALCRQAVAMREAAADSHN